MTIIQSKIQSLVLNFIDCLMSNEAYQLEVPRNEGILSESNKCLIRSFDNPVTARKYCQLLSIAALIGEMDATSRHISQRDLYYALKLMFKSQRGNIVFLEDCLCGFFEIPFIHTSFITESNTMILECGLLLGLKRHEMRILTSARGKITVSTPQAKSHFPPTLL